MQEKIAAQLAVARQPVLQTLRLLHKVGFVLDALGKGVLDAKLIIQGCLSARGRDIKAMMTVDASFHTHRHLCHVGQSFDRISRTDALASHSPHRKRGIPGVHHA